MLDKLSDLPLPTVEKFLFSTNGTSNTKVKISHGHTHTYSGTPGVDKSAAWGPIRGVRLSSDHSILQIPTCNYAGRSDSTLYLLSTSWDDGGDHPLDPSPLTTQSRTCSQETAENNRLVRGKQRPLHLLPRRLFKTKTLCFEYKYPLCCV